MSINEIERKLLIEQIKRETLDDLKKYLIGYCQDGEMTATKSGNWDGYIFLIPDEKYKELFTR